MGWLGAWVDGIYAFHHFHSTAHEVLGIVAGSASVILGGPKGRRFEAVAPPVADIGEFAIYCPECAEREFGERRPQTDQN